MPEETSHTFPDLRVAYKLKIPDYYSDLGMAELCQVAATSLVSKTTRTYANLQLIAKNAGMLLKLIFFVAVTVISPKSRLSTTGHYRIPINCLYFSFYSTYAVSPPPPLPSAPSHLSFIPLPLLGEAVTTKAVGELPHFLPFRTFT